MNRWLRLHRHHQLAAVLFAAVVIWDTAGALLFAAAEHRSGWTGLYWALTTVTTVGYGDVIPHSHAGHVIAVAVMLTILPLGVIFGLVASGFIAGHVKHLEQMIGEPDERPRKAHRPG